MCLSYNLNDHVVNDKLCRSFLGIKAVSDLLRYPNSVTHWLALYLVFLTFMIKTTRSGNILPYNIKGLENIHSFQYRSGHIYQVYEYLFLLWEGDKQYTRCCTDIFLVLQTSLLLWFALHLVMFIFLFLEISDNFT